MSSERQTDANGKHLCGGCGKWKWSLDHIKKCERPRKLHARNDSIRTEWKRGFGVAELSRKWGLTQQSIERIVSTESSKGI